ncbi:hypothetical protein [Methanosarcina sp.]|uniref:hypothetical protein n=1 Tax=Methanosarcina sp. TaxID=2213 RepID=UPI002ABB57AF|nr:hypothetical protein [Methanosarcina sp.]MDY9925674.1 hypothetical protein [Methanosarcina sp.]
MGDLSHEGFFRENHCTVCTHKGSSMGRNVTDITKLFPQLTILDGLAVRGKE